MIQVFVRLFIMFPVLFSVGSFSVSSFGVLVAIGYLFAIFLVWRLSRAWDLDEEKILDLSLLTFLGGMIGARAYFVAERWDLFAPSLEKIIFFYKLPGFSFWGGLLGGWLALFYFTKKFKMDFWQIADIASVGFLGGLIFGQLGCFLGGCSVGVPSKLFFAVPQVGAIGTRFPVQILEAALLSIVLVKVWSRATHFHIRGSIVALVFILVSAIKLLLKPLVANKGWDFFFLTVLLTLGLVIFYKVTKKNIFKDIRGWASFIKEVFTRHKMRKLLLEEVKKSWYNQTTAFEWKVRNFKKLLRRINVRFSQQTNKNN